MLPPNDIHEYYNTKLPNPKLHREYNHQKITQGLSTAMKSMRILGPKETEGLGPKYVIWEAYKFGRSEGLKTSDMSKETFCPKISTEHQAERGQQDVCRMSLKRWGAGEVGKSTKDKLSQLWNFSLRAPLFLTSAKNEITNSFRKTGPTVTP